MSGITVGAPARRRARPQYQPQAQRVWMDYWGSGKPGTRTWLALNNYPERLAQLHRGRRRLAEHGEAKELRHLHHHRAATSHDWKRITIPSTAAPGYAYWVWASHDAMAHCRCSTWFQVCTLKPSQDRREQGHGNRPQRRRADQGALREQEGNAEVRPIYKTTSSSLAAKGQPPVSGGRRLAAKWTRVGRARTDGLGKYRKGFNPSGTHHLVRRLVPGRLLVLMRAGPRCAKVTVR